MIDEHKEELASLYVLGLLSGEELVMFQNDLDRDPELHALTDSLRNAAGHLAFTAPSATPSEKLRARIFDSIEKIDTASKPTPRKKGPAAIWAGWAVAAGFAVLASYLGALWTTTRSQLILQMDQEDFAALELRSLQQKVEATRIVNDRQLADLQRESSLDRLKIAQLAALNGNSPEAVAIAVWNPLKQEGVLSVQDLPKVNADQEYQMWVIDAHHKNPVSSGLFTVDEHGRAHVAFHPVESTEAAMKFAISRERKGGAATPQGPIVAAGAF